MDKSIIKWYKNTYDDGHDVFYDDGNLGDYSVFYDGHDCDDYIHCSKD